MFFSLLYHQTVLQSDKPMDLKHYQRSVATKITLIYRLELALTEVQMLTFKYKALYTYVEYGQILRDLLKIYFIIFSFLYVLFDDITKIEIILIKFCLIVCQVVMLVNKCHNFRGIFTQSWTFKSRCLPLPLVS